MSVSGLKFQVSFRSWYILKSYISIPTSQHDYIVSLNYIMLHYIIMIRILILKTGNIKKLSLMLMLLDGIYRRHHSVSFSNIKEDQVKRNNWTFFCQNCHNLRILSDKLEKIGDLARFEKFHV